MKTSGILTQFALLLDCADTLKAVNIDQWEQFSPQQRRGIGFIGRWVIEKSLWSVIVARGQVPPFNASLMKLYALSEMKLLPEDELLLALVDKRVITEEFSDGLIEEDYKNAFFLAHTVRNTAHNLVTIWDVMKRKQKTADKETEESSK